MSWYQILKFLHVVFAITAVGANITYGVWLARAARDPEHTAFALKGLKSLDDRVANPAYGLLLVTGLLMLYTGGIRWTTPWVLSGLTLYVIVVALAAGVYTPALARQIAALESGGMSSPNYRAHASRARTVGLVIAVLVVVIVFLMVTKPALWG